MNSTIEIIKQNWREKLSDKKFRWSFLLSLIFLAIGLYVIANILIHIEQRPGVSFKDPLLITFEAVDLTWITFILIYGALIAALISMTKHPLNMLWAVQSYSILISMRVITIYFLPLEAPQGIIPMEDPFVAFFGGGQTYLKDLFFSGHTSTMFLLFLVNPHKKFRYIFLIATILVGASVLVQHVHYTIDVIAAPFFAYTAYRVSRLINRKKMK
jgi:membrane-associated phospholipid phosphatase